MIKIALSNMTKTLICVAIAGVLFITAIIYHVKPLFFVAAFFDWLPLPVGWMKFKNHDEKIRRAGIFHGVVTLIAYIIGILWLIFTEIKPVDLGYVFLELWFIAVIAGAYVTGLKAEQ